MNPETWTPASAGVTKNRFSKILHLSLLAATVPMWLFSADIKPTPTPKPTPVHRLRMGDVDKRESGWWARTRSFLETGIAVGLFFWIPGTRVEIQTDHVKISN